MCDTEAYEDYPIEHPDDRDEEFDTGVDGDPLEEAPEDEWDALSDEEMLEGHRVETVDLDLSDVDVDVEEEA